MVNGWACKAWEPPREGTVRKTWSVGCQPLRMDLFGWEKEKKDQGDFHQGWWC